MHGYCLDSVRASFLKSVLYKIQVVFCDFCQVLQGRRRLAVGTYQGMPTREGRRVWRAWITLTGSTVTVHDGGIRVGAGGRIKLMGGVGFGCAG